MPLSMHTSRVASCSLAMASSVGSVAAILGACEPAVDVVQRAPMPVLVNETAHCVGPFDALWVGLVVRDQRDVRVNANTNIVRHVQSYVITLFKGMNPISGARAWPRLSDEAEASVSVSAFADTTSAVVVQSSVVSNVVNFSSS